MKSLRWPQPCSCAPQVFRRLSALATRVLAFYLKRAPLGLVPPPPPHTSTDPSTQNPSQPPAVSPPQPAASSPPLVPPAQPPAAASPAPAAGPAQPSTSLFAGLSLGPSTPGAAALEELLLWLTTCRDLFSKRCAATGRLMAWDPSVQYPVPPIFRAFK